MLIIAGLAVAQRLGIRGFAAGLFVNVLCVGYAVAVVTAMRLWGEVGLLVRWRSWHALLWLLPFVVEALSWLWPGGPRDHSPGLVWWTLTFLLVGINEELVSRGAVLTRLSRSLSPRAAVVWCGLLFGMQPFSALATSTAPLDAVVTNVALTAAYGLALAAYQMRFVWLWPLILVHAASDLAGELTAGSPGDAVILPVGAMMITVALVLLMTQRRAPSAVTCGLDVVQHRWMALRDAGGGPARRDVRRPLLRAAAHFAVADRTTPPTGARLFTCSDTCAGVRPTPAT